MGVSRVSNCMIPQLANQSIEDVPEKPGRQLPQEPAVSKQWFLLRAVQSGVFEQFTLFTVTATLLTVWNARFMSFVENALSNEEDNTRDALVSGCTVTMTVDVVALEELSMSMA